MSAREDTGDLERERVHRRGFFTQGFRHILRPLADLVEKRMEALEVAAGGGEEPRWGASREGSYGYSAPYPAGDAAPGRSQSATPARRLLPPGALPEGEFLSRCTSSGRCVAACPVNAIKVIRDEDPRWDRKPGIDPALQACVVCDDLSCMKACPSGALQIVSKAEIRMGRAVLRRETCVRSHGEDCRICADKCPIGPSAIEIPQAGADVLVKDACTGCGVCEMYCPTDPRAIVVEPRAW
ncbi:MAG: 4Fe-4S dicluster domain-containing protein [Planctomycetes bacterium]|nr:4Fe-4S dicluster domain-containing protein [Planctomycetota bacterium]